MNIETTELGDATVLRPDDELDLLGYQALAEKIDEVVDASRRKDASRSGGHSKIVLDLGAVTYVNSPAVNVLLGAAAKAEKAGSQIALVNLRGGAKTVLEAFGALTTLPVYATVADAASAPS